MVYHTPIFKYNFIILFLVWEVLVQEIYFLNLFCVIYALGSLGVVLNLSGGIIKGLNRVSISIKT